MTEFIQNNWFWIFVVLFIGMHLFGGGCGMGHHRRPKTGPDEESKSGDGKGCH
jgi:hypothetical protein